MLLTGLQISKTNDADVFKTAGDLALEDLWRAARWMPELKSAMNSFRSIGTAVGDDYALVCELAVPYRDALDIECCVAT